MQIPWTAFALQEAPQISITANGAKDWQPVTGVEKEAAYLSRERIVNENGAIGHDDFLSDSSQPAKMDTQRN
jgi:hypothetical protein